MILDRNSLFQAHLLQKQQHSPLTMSNPHDNQYRPYPVYPPGQRTRPQPTLQTGQEDLFWDPRSPNDPYNQVFTPNSSNSQYENYPSGGQVDTDSKPLPPLPQLSPYSNSVYSQSVSHMSHISAYSIQGQPQQHTTEDCWAW